MSESIEILDKAIGESKVPPKGIKVGKGLWDDLTKSGRVKHLPAKIVPLNNSTPDIEYDAEMDLPFLDGNIYVYCDLTFDDYSYELPKNS